MYARKQQHLVPTAQQLGGLLCDILVAICVGFETDSTSVIIIVLFLNCFHTCSCFILDMFYCIVSHSELPHIKQFRNKIIMIMIIQVLLWEMCPWPIFSVQCTVAVHKQHPAKHNETKKQINIKLWEYCLKLKQQEGGQIHIFKMDAPIWGL